jgi:phage I-like protein
MNKELKAGDVIPNVQITPYGDYDNVTTDGREVTQHCDREAFDKIVSNFTKELIVDVDHQSELTDNTEAAGWITTLKADDEKGLVGDIKVSELGAKLLNGLNYRFGSPAFLLDENDRPMKLTSFALTNRPALTDIAPVYNSAPKQETVIISGDNPPSILNEQELVMKEDLIKMLGLPQDATDEMIMNSVSKTVSELAEIKKGEAEKALNEAADAFVKDLPEDIKDSVRNSYIKDKDVATEIVNAVKDKLALANQAVLNKQEAEKPTITSAWETYNSLPQDQKLAFAKKHKNELN